MNIYGGQCKKENYLKNGRNIKIFNKTKNEH